MSNAKISSNSKFTSFVIIAAIIAAFSIALAGGGAYYSVTGVDEDDVLNIRKSAGSKAEIVGTIPFDEECVWATGRKMAVKSAAWVEVDYNGAVGWVNAKFLQKVADQESCSNE